MREVVETFLEPDFVRSAPDGARAKCPACGESFVKTRRNKLYCSRACAKARAARMVLENRDEDLIERRRRRKADGNARLIERLDQLSVEYVQLVSIGRNRDHTQRFLEYVLVSARECGPLRQPLSVNVDRFLVG